MSFAQSFDRRILVRLILSAVLGCAAAGLFFLNRTDLSHSGTGGPGALPRGSPDQSAGKRSDGREPGLPEAFASIDREIDSVLHHLGIEPDQTRRKEIPVPHSEYPRIERRVLLPWDIAPVTVNAALNTMARRYRGRAIGSENMTEHTVTIHIEVEGLILETIVLKPSPLSAPKHEQRAQDRTRT
jgi:hypothetical protein